MTTDLVAAPWTPALVSTEGDDDFSEFYLTCQDCGALFDPGLYPPPSIYRRCPTCRPAAAKAAQVRGRQTRRARKLSAPVVKFDPVTIFMRDCWMCQICGTRTVRSVVSTHPLYPVIDHVRPLSRGGAHEPGNVQCAHRVCNGRKGARWGATPWHCDPPKGV